MLRDMSLMSSVSAFGVLAVRVLAGGALLCPLPVAAQPYPMKVVRVIVPFPPGAGVDIVARTIIPRLADTFGQQFVIDNRAGAAGNLGAEIAAHAPPDGYTLLFTPASIASSQALYQKLGYDLAKDLEPISMVAAAPFVPVVHPSLPVRTVKELIAMAKSKPGKLLYASTGNGSSPHLTTELFRLHARINAGLEVVGSSSEQLAATIKSEIAKLRKVIKDAGIKVD